MMKSLMRRKNPLFKGMNIKELAGNCEQYIKNNINDKRKMESLYIKLEEIRRVIRR